MVQEAASFTFEAMTAIGTFCTGIAAAIGIFKLIRNLTGKDETLYGDEAVERFHDMEHTLSQVRVKNKYPFIGGPAKIIPQLTITRLRYDPQLMPIKYKGCKKTIRFIYEDEPGKPVEEVWRLK